MFQKTKNIDTAFRHIKGFSLLLVAGCILLSGFVLYKSYELSARVQDKIYILAGDQAMEAYASKEKITCWWKPRAISVYSIPISLLSTLMKK